MSASSSVGAKRMFDLPEMLLYKCKTCGAEMLREKKIRKNTEEKFSLGDDIKVIRYSLLKAYSKHTQNLPEAYSQPTGFPLVVITITVAM